MSSVEDIKVKVLPILWQYPVKRAGLFGSLVRGELGDDSDIDVLVDLDINLSLLDMIEIKLSLEDILDRPVDLVEYTTIKPHLRERILNEEVRIL